MKKKFLQEYLGMAVDMLYNHHHRLNEEIIFLEGYWKQLQLSADIEYWKNMKDSLEYALKANDYCLGIVTSPFLERYSEKDFRIFFEKLYLFLLENLKDKIN